MSNDASSLIQPSRLTTQTSACVFRCGERQIALDVRAVAETTELERLTALPCTPDLLLGMSNLRGTPLPVVELARLFGDAPRPRELPLIVLVFRHQDLLAGLVVDAVLRVLPYGAADLLPLATEADSLADRLLAHGEDCIQLLDPDRLRERLLATCTTEHQS